VPVREALKTLEAEGQVKYFPQRGFQVTRLSLDELHETYEIRRLLEDEIVRIAGAASRSPLRCPGANDERDGERGGRG
jgi:DNA-binding GntR family transcriptional regulator